MDMAASVGDMPNSRAMVGRAGAMMVETMIRLKPVADSTSVTIHFLPARQSCGLEGSLGRNATRYGSVSSLVASAPLQRPMVLACAEGVTAASILSSSADEGMICE